MEISPLQRNVKAADLPLEKLAGSSKISDKDKAAEVARQFESILLRQILAESQKTVFSSRMNPQSTTTGIYQDMITNQLAESISRSGAFGFAHSLDHQLGRELKSETSTPSSPAAAAPQSL